MRRILMVAAMAAVAVGVTTPAGAVTTSCNKPVTAAGLPTVGVDVPPGDAVVCIYKDKATRFEVGGSPVVYTYGTSGAAGGAYGSFCWYEGSDYTCVDGGAAPGAFSSFPTGDAASLFLMPTVCEHHSSYMFKHCFAVILVAGADGPTGSSMGAGGGVFVCEEDGYYLYCPVAEGIWVP